MFVAVARVTLGIPDSGSLKAKRQVLRRVTDRVKARFNVSVSEVDEQDLWQKATIALAVVGGDKRHVNEQIDKILQFIEDMYVAPVLSRESEIIAFGDAMFSGQSTIPGLPIEMGERSLAEAEGLGDWDNRTDVDTSERGKKASKTSKGYSLDEARERARQLRNRHDWEKD